MMRSTFSRSTLETSLHLYQPARYTISKSVWRSSWPRIVSDAPRTVTLDEVAVASALSFGMVCQDRTLLREISRQPWLSRITASGEAALEKIPPHGLLRSSPADIASDLYELLLEEARRATANRDQVYVLLSGGLDSRIIAIVARELYEEGSLPTKPIAVTWGIESSRDVVYARKTAALLGLPWHHLPLGAADLVRNLGITAEQLGLLHSPELLHSIPRLEHLEERSLVLAGSFGDSIGRGEFAGLTLLQLKKKVPTNPYGLLEPNVFAHASRLLREDLESLVRRARRGGPQFPWALREHWMQGSRMRGGLCHALSLLNHQSSVYQMFTDPSVYRYMWSLSPDLRDNRPYEIILRTKHSELASLPWARTNRALSGPTRHRSRHALPDYHRYTGWCGRELWPLLSELIDLEWYAEQRIFSVDGIRTLLRLARGARARIGRQNDVLLWLAGYRLFVDSLRLSGREFRTSPDIDLELGRPARPVSRSLYLLERTAGRSEYLYRLCKRFQTAIRGASTILLRLFQRLRGARPRSLPPSQAAS